MVLFLFYFHRWTYSNDSETQAVFYDGQLAYYGAGGYYFDFPKKESDAITFIEDLEENTWLNRGTRAVFVDFTIYNGNINAISVAKYVECVFSFNLESNVNL